MSNPSGSDQTAIYSPNSLVRARVCAASQERYTLRFEAQGPHDAAITCALSEDAGAECDAVPAGALRWNADLPAVGDWVRARRVDATLALIETVEPRTTCISRRRPGAFAGGATGALAANVDLILIVMGLDGDYNLRRLERYLVLAASARGAEAMVALNKRDVCPEWPARLAEVQALMPHAIALSAHESVAPIAEAVRGRTVVLLGSSGAGKSTIANALARRVSPDHPTRKGVRLARPPHDDPPHAHRTSRRRRPDRHTGPA